MDQTFKNEKEVSPMIDIVIHGINGRMGQVLCELISQRQDCRVAAGVDLHPSDGPIPVVSRFADLPVKGDVVIDFSTASAVDEMLDWCAESGVPAVVCTTGLSEATQQHLTEAAEKVALFKSANMSMGINLLIALAKKATHLLGLDYDIEIVEKHHHNKVDAPSGTALMIADAINEEAGGAYHYVYDRHDVRQKRDPHEIGLHAVRGGSIVGEHEVLFCGPDEVITLSHSAASRGVFANGAINAAVYLAGRKPGLYTMADLLGDLT